MNHFVADISMQDASQKNMLIALLTSEGCNGIEEISQNCLKAFFPNKHPLTYWEKVMQCLSHNFPMQFRLSSVKTQNWSNIWQKQYNPVTEGQVGIRASFHPPFPKQIKYSITIDPTMAFGTGHHESTALMIKGMQLIPFTGKRVLDFGCGTGILSILASKLGAESVVAIDSDTNAIEIAEENIALNQIENVRINKGGIEWEEKASFHIILANINQEVIEESADELRKKLFRNGRVLVSGIRSVEFDSINKKLNLAGFTNNFQLHESGWVCSLFIVQ